MRFVTKRCDGLKDAEWFNVYDTAKGRREEIATVHQSYIELFMRALHNEAHPVLSVNSDTGEV